MPKGMGYRKDGAAKPSHMKRGSGGSAKLKSSGRAAVGKKKAGKG